MGTYATTPGLIYHPQLGACEYQLTEISSDPDTQVSQVIGLMNGYASQDAKSSQIAADCAGCRTSGDPLSDTWNYLSRRGGSRGMQFQRDEITGAPVESILPKWEPVVETLIRPADLALMPYPIGDCDDFASYGAAHILSNGVPCSFVTIAADPQFRSVFSHVYLAAYPASGPYAGRRVPVDLSHGWYLGWEHPGAYRLKEWPIGTSTSSSFLIAGLIAAGGYLLYKGARSRGMN